MFSFLVEIYSLVSGKSTSLHIKAGGINTLEILKKITGILKCIADKLCVCRLTDFEFVDTCGTFLYDVKTEDLKQCVETE